jgi:hypothetical protein
MSDNIDDNKSTPDATADISQGNTAEITASDATADRPKTEANTDHPFPDTSRHPGFISVYDPETFHKAGLDPLDTLNGQYTEYNAVVADAEALRTSLDGDQWSIVLKKARLGGLVTVAKFMTQGSKAAVARDFRLSEDTTNRYEHLYKFLPWSYARIRKEAADAAATGRDYQYSIDKIISEGAKAAERAGATVRRAKYHGAGKCLLIDPVNRTTNVEDLPSNFSVSRVKRQHWAEVDAVSDKDGFRVWQEIDKDAGFRGLRFFKIGSESFHSRRVMVARINRRNEVLDLGDTTEVVERIDFDAREPKDVQVIGIDPTKGTIRWGTVKDDALLDKARPIALHRTLTGLSLYQKDPDSQFLFTLGDEQFRGPSVIVQQDSDGWLMPIVPTLSIGDVAQDVWFTALNALKVATGEPSIDTDQLYEVLTDDLVMRYFPRPQGWTGHHPLYIALSQMGGGDAWLTNLLLQKPSEQAKARDLVRIIDDRAMWHVPKLREVVAAVIAEEMAPKPEAVPEVPDDGRDQQTHILLNEDSAAEAFDIPFDDLCALLISKGLTEGTECLPTEDAEDQGYIVSDGDNWVWSITMLDDLIAEQTHMPDPAEASGEDASTVNNLVGTITDSSERIATTSEESGHSGQQEPWFSFPDVPSRTVSEAEPADKDAAARDPSTTKATETALLTEEPWFSFRDDSTGTTEETEPPKSTSKKLADRIADLEQENHRLRAQLADSERLRIEAQERLEMLEKSIVHLHDVTPRIKVLDYRLTVQGERGEQVVWRSPNSERPETTSH